MAANYTLGWVMRDGDMHDSREFGTDRRAAIQALRKERERSDPSYLHWYVYDKDDPERGCFDSEEED